MSFIIRKVKDTDKTELSALFPPQDLEGANSYFGRCFQEHLSGQREIFIARQQEDGQLQQNNEVIGMVTLNYSPRYWLYQRLEIPEIQDLQVLPAWRRKGIGAALIAHAEQRVREQGREQIGISVGLNPDFGPAQRLYIRLGYCPDGYGVTYDRKTVASGQSYPLDDDLCLMMVKDL